MKYTWMLHNEYIMNTLLNWTFNLHIRGVEKMLGARLGDFHTEKMPEKIPGHRTAPSNRWSSEVVRRWPPHPRGGSYQGTPGWSDPSGQPYEWRWQAPPRLRRDVVQSQLRPKETKPIQLKHCRFHREW